MYRDMDAETSRRLRSGSKALTPIKDVLKTKLDKTLRTNLFNNTVLLAMLYASETWATMKKEEQ